MTPEEFLAAVAAVHRYMLEAAKPLEIREKPVMWKAAARLRE